MKELIMIQQGLKAPKNQYNTFGNYKYRSCEDILEAVKPLLMEQACVLLLSDEIVAIDGRHYVKATATIINSEGQSHSTSAYAREPEDKKGMDASQITGTASSYARKYALNGLFCIDDTKDADTMDNTSEGTGHSAPKDDKEWMTEKQYNDALARISKGYLDTLDKAQAAMKMKKAYREGLEAAIKNYKEQYNIQ